MKTTEFTAYWNKAYPEAKPINYTLKHVYPDRWLRIHSLPESKRYAETEVETKIILERQNQLFEELIGEGSEIIISIGRYRWNQSVSNQMEYTNFGEFEKVHRVDLLKELPDEYDEESYLDIFIKIENWKRGRRDDILQAIANDDLRAMFICPSKKCIIAPYDGGVDIIVDSREKRDNFKLKYKNWLSQREDGL